MPVPFIGRLNPVEYGALVGSFVLVGLEALIRILTLALPTTLLSLFYTASQRLFNRFVSPAEKQAQDRRKSLSTSIRNASDFVDLCAQFGYYAEEHVVPTKDGYLLGIHRLAWRKGEEDLRVNNGPRSLRKPVIYMHHGLLMNSEVWVCLTDKERCLPFMLVERGFDVWLGNNRGNKYSKKSVKYSPQSTEFWNFSIDEFAFHDIPDSIQYILEFTKQPSLSYIGFSQGTAQSFASLAIHPKLNDQVNVFIALAPAMSPAGLNNGVVDALVKASPQVLFLLFGRRSILASATMWQSILYPPIFVRVIDLGLDFLFGWKAQNISMSQKLSAYPHLYSFTSTKSVVHWFQIIRNKCFQMYDDDVHPPLSTSSRYTKVAKYPTRNIKTPIVLVYGGSDSLVDIKVMLRELPNRTVATEIPHYEHLDFLWARDVDTQVFQHVYDALDNFKDAEHTKEEFESYRRARHVSLGRSASFRHQYHNSDAVESDSTNTRFETTPNPAMAHRAREGSPTNTATESIMTDASATTLTVESPGTYATEPPASAGIPSSVGGEEEEAPVEPSPAPAQDASLAKEEEVSTEAPAVSAPGTSSADDEKSYAEAASAPVPDIPSSATVEEVSAEPSSAAEPSQKEPSSVDGAAETTSPEEAAKSVESSPVDTTAEAPSPAAATKSNTSKKKSSKRRESGASLSFDSAKDGKGRAKRGGIKIGASKPVGGVVTGTSDESAWKAADDK